MPKRDSSTGMATGDVRVDIAPWKEGITQCDVYVDGVHVFSGVQWIALMKKMEVGTTELKFVEELWRKRND